MSVAHETMARALRLTRAACLIRVTVLAAALTAGPTWAQDQMPGAGRAPTPVDCGDGSRTPLRLRAEDLQRQHAAAAPGAARAALAYELARALVELNRPAQALPLLDEAAARLAGVAGARARVERGNLQLARREAAAAEADWGQALAAAPDDADISTVVELNRLRSLQAPQRAARLQALASKLQALPAGDGRAPRWWINLGARAAEAGPAGWPLAADAYTQALRAAQAAQDSARSIEALDAQAELLERQGRTDEALQTTLRALALLPSTPWRDLAIPLEARIGRLSLAAGDDARAVAAYRRALGHIEAVRADIPVVYEDGRSSFRTTLAPVYLGLTDALLKQAARADDSTRQALLRSARATVELSKQSEMEDYLADRCTVKNSLARQTYAPPAGTAVLYPVMLADRLELLLETDAGIERFQSAIGEDALRGAVLTFVNALRGGTPLRAQAERLHRTLLAPLQPALERQRIQTLVFVPDGVLRLLPLAALHDGRDYVLRRYELVTVPAMSVLGQARRPPGQRRVLLAGLSEPGPVVGQLTPAMVKAIGVDPQPNRGAGSAGDGPPPDVERALQQALALPGVKTEVEEIARQSGGRALINADFTLAALRQALLAGDRDVLHIASHGSFGATAEQTFLMAYDGLLSLDELQRMLQAEPLRQHPLDLITLSACQTAEGDDRAPLGMSGAAIKARARSALGTLWPVNDTAALEVMTDFYRRLAAGAGKAAALRGAQLALLDRQGYQHPFFWAPFTLVGDWQ